MIVFKFNYETDEESLKLIKDYQRQYTSCFNVAYNLLASNEELMSLGKYKIDSIVNDKLMTLNNVELMQERKWLRQCCVQEAYSLAKESKKVVFNRKNFIRRCKNLISRKEFLTNKKYKQIYSIGTANPYKGNKCFEILDDFNILFKPSRDIHVVLKLVGIGKRVEKLRRLFIKQNDKDTPITYRLSDKEITIIVDEKVFSEKEVEKIQNRVFGIDLNPNYVGWSIVDWKSENEFDVIEHGVYSYKDLNDKDFSLKKLKLPSNSSERLHLCNKRKNETIEIAKDIIKKAIHYKCSIISLEKLDIQSSDRGKGKKLNSLCNNKWLRNKFVDAIKKRCNLFGLTCLEVLPNYSSFIGNFIFRNLNLPDMVLASIELGRRGYEFNLQYVKKIKEKKKNIIQPDVDKFKDFYLKSLEEFKVEREFKDLVELYYFIKKSKILYRLSLDLFMINKLKFYRESSMIYKLTYS